MIWDTLQTTLRRFSASEPAPTSLSRREALAGLGLAGLVAFTAPTLLAAGDAVAQPRGRGRGGRRGRRYSGRDLRRRCRDRRFRRRNWRLCQAGQRRRRPGTCVRIGDAEICF